jgi:hypothetical protein
MFHPVDRISVTVQPAGPAGKRHVFLTVTFRESSARQVEFVLPERAANQLGEALMSGSHGVMREFDLAVSEDELRSRRDSLQS